MCPWICHHSRRFGGWLLIGSLLLGLVCPLEAARRGTPVLRPLDDTIDEPTVKQSGNQVLDARSAGVCAEEGEIIAGINVGAAPTCTATLGDIAVAPFFNVELQQIVPTTLRDPTFVVGVPAVCADDRQRLIDTSPTFPVPYNCPNGTGSSPIIEPHSFPPQVCVDLTCVTPTEPDWNLNLVEGANVTLTGPTLTGGNVVEVTIAATGGGGGGSRRVKHPLRLMTIEPGDANATASAAVNGTNVDWDGVTFVDNATGCANYKHRISAHIAATEAWEIGLVHKAVSGAGGNAAYTVHAKSYGANEAFDAAGTALVSATSCAGSACVVATNTSANTAINTIDGGNDFDAEEPLVANEFLVVRFCRLGGHANDTVGAPWMVLDLTVEYLETD